MECYIDKEHIFVFLPKKLRLLKLRKDILHHSLGTFKELSMEKDTPCK